MLFTYFDAPVQVSVPLSQQRVVELVDIVLDSGLGDIQLLQVEWLGRLCYFFLLSEVLAVFDLVVCDVDKVKFEVF